MNHAPHNTTPDELASEFLKQYQQNATYLREHIARLAAIATAGDTTVAETGTRALFGLMIEPLADSFTAAGVSLYNRVFVQIIEHCRRLEAGGPLDRALRGFGMKGEADLAQRAEGLRSLRPPAALRNPEAVRRVIVLSRVTLGADVAVTSVIIERLKREFGAAEIFLLGGSKVGQLFGGDPRLSFKEISYGRAATTAGRLQSWLDVVQAIGNLTAGLLPREWLVADPDSRLTQLGLLPVTRQEENYVFFPSREYGEATSSSLAELAALWLDDLFSSHVPLPPALSLRPEDRLAAQEMIGIMRGENAGPIVTVNFGVGGNPAKRLTNRFEQLTVLELLRTGAQVILDKGAGDDEARRVDSIVARARADAAVFAVEITEHSESDTTRGARVVVWNGGIGRLAALIEQSDLYLGYDSAGQHLAAASGTPCVEIFAGYSSPRMLDRWRPTGCSISRIIAVDPAVNRDSAEILTDTLAAARNLIAEL